MPPRRRAGGSAAGVEKELSPAETKAVEQVYSQFASGGKSLERELGPDGELLKVACPFCKLKAASLELLEKHASSVFKYVPRVQCVESPCSFLRCSVWDRVGAEGGKR
eukprot:2233573-Pyramimonas_sp.AAC.1